MRVGALLLTSQNQYLINDRLPYRPVWDKEWLKYLCDNANGITYSPNTSKDLPLWAKKPNMDWDLNLGIATFEDKPDLLLITRSPDHGIGPEFRLDEYEKVNVEVWRRKC